MYTEQFRSEARKKVLLRGSRTIDSIANELGMPPPTLKSWLRASVTMGSNMKKNHFGPKSKKRSLEEKFKIVLEAAALKESDLGEYLRRHGLHSQELEQWQKELSEQLRGPSKAERKEDNKLRFANVRLEKEVHRKDKALAEASALLILKKKASILWGTDEGDEE